jgi:hypothetical protein
MTPAQALPSRQGAAIDTAPILRYRNPILSGCYPDPAAFDWFDYEGRE